MRNEEAMAFIAEKMTQRGIRRAQWCIEKNPMRLLFIGRDAKTGLPSRCEFPIKRSWSKQLVSYWIERNVPAEMVWEAAE